MPQPLDAIVTVNSQMECEALGFSSLSASSSGVATSEDKDNQSKRARAEWSVNLGESASAIVVARHHHQTRSPNFDIIVLGERTIFCLKDSGGIRTSKLLDLPLLSLRAYPAKPGGPDHLLVGTATGQVLVYGNQLQLLWAASLDQPPVGVAIVCVCECVCV
jgi:Bardet-Biedl syndrome 9 protein